MIDFGLAELLEVGSPSGGGRRPHSRNRARECAVGALVEQGMINGGA